VPQNERPSGADALSLLARGEIEVQGRMPWSSNGTFLVTVSQAGVAVPGIYKPHRGERPLWDFPGGLHQREVAAFALSEALGWRLVPATVLRDDAPLGVGSLQWFVDADFEQHYFTLLEDGRHHAALRAMATFDLVANNADRKSGHCLLDAEGHLWGIDHGLCFHAQPKLRTVIWDFAGEPIPGSLLDDLRRLIAAPPPALVDLLDRDEVAAVVRRAEAVIRLAEFPNPGEARPYPWPLV
jgi:uncharacterized repeat protein (TIGR03843 family)